MRVITTLICMLLVSLLVFPVMSFAAVQPIQLFLNGKQLSAEVPPRIVQNNTIVPVRVIAESLGSEVKWEEKSRKVTVDKSGVNIQLFIDKHDALVNEKSFKLETAPTIVEGNTMLPLRFVSEQFGVNVTWDELTRSVFLQQEAAAVVSGKEQADASLKDNKPADQQSGKNEPSSDKKSDKDKPSSDKQPEAAKPGDKSSDKPSDKSAAGGAQDKGNNAGSSADKPGTKPADKSPDKTADKPSDKSADKPGDKSGDKPGDKAADKTGDKVTGKPGEKQQDKTDSGKDGKQGDGTGDKETKETKTAIRSISLEGTKFVVKTNGASAKPTVTAQPDKNQIIIDIANAELDPALKLNDKGEGEIQQKNENVAKIRYLLFSKESSIVRIIIDLSKKVDFRPSTAFSATSSQLSWTLTAAKDQYKVVIDPGHGGKDTGAKSFAKRFEKEFVISLGAKVHKLLEKEPRIQSYMTREDDTFIELEDRVQFANDMKADLFVSVHGNAAVKESIEGVETYYYTEQSLDFAKQMHEKLLKSTKFNDRKVKQNDFYVVKNTTMPSVLLEIGFLTNKSEEAAMFQNEFQDQVAASIVAAIKQQLNID